MTRSSTGGFYRPSVRMAGLFLLVWIAPVILELLIQQGGGSTWFGTVGLGGHIPLYYLPFVSGIFFLWMLADLFFIRRAPAEFRKAQWATSILMLLLYTLAAVGLESLVTAMDYVARQPS